MAILTEFPDTVTMYALCKYLHIAPSAIQFQVEKKLILPLGISGFSGLVGSSELLRHILVKIGLLNAEIEEVIQVEEQTPAVMEVPSIGEYLEHYETHDSFDVEKYQEISRTDKCVFGLYVQEFTVKVNDDEMTFSILELAMNKITLKKSIIMTNPRCSKIYHFKGPPWGLNFFSTKHEKLKTRKEVIT